MVTREQALGVLNKLKENKPTKLFNKASETSAGMNFVLVYLSEHKENVYASTIADKMQISRARIAVLIQKLISKSLIEKTVSNDDARIEVLKITPLGIKEVNAFKEKMISALIKVIEEVGLKRIYKFIETSAKINHILDEME